MKLQFLGANRQVTGSRYCLEADGRRLMIDCGLVQEREFAKRNWEDAPVPPDDCVGLLLTHVHIDHSGLIPRYVKQGYRGPIYTSRASADLAEIMFRDSARIQEEDAAYKRKRHRKEGRRSAHPEEPLYSEADVDATLPLLRPLPMRQATDIGDNFRVTMHDAGHILGSAIIEVDVKEAGRECKVVFSGDIGQWDRPLIRNPALPDAADYLVMESTYGDRDHPEGGDIEDQLRDVVNDTVGRGGSVVIPTFAVERAQQLMYYISRLVHRDRIPDIPIFLDSPMAVDVTQVYRQHRDSLDQETMELIVSNEPPLRFPGLKLVTSADESKAINRVNGPCIVMATSGMCTAGRIKHHLRQHIGRPEATVLFVGYQGKGTLGRQISDGADKVRIHGREYPVRAGVQRLYGFSGHGDRADLLRWSGNLREAPRTLFLTHGDEEASLALADTIRSERGWSVNVPEYGDEVEL